MPILASNECRMGGHSMNRHGDLEAGLKRACSRHGINKDKKGAMWKAKAKLDRQKGMKWREGLEEQNCRQHLAKVGMGQESSSFADYFEAVDAPPLCVRGLGPPAARETRGISAQ